MPNAECRMPLTPLHQISFSLQMAESDFQGLMTAEAVFEEHFKGKPEIRGVAPGRVNLIGEHTDYNDGFVFPAAIDREVWICARKTKGPSKLFSKEMGPAKEFKASEVSPGDIKGWAAYGAGVAWALSRSTGKPLPNIEAVVHGEVPIGSGVSSSAALELAFAVIWNEIADLKLSNKELAKIGQQCENKFVGVNSGIMDQMASAMGKEGKALFIDIRSLKITYAAIPTELTIALCDTGKQRELANSAYNERREQCEQACKDLGVKALRDATMEMLQAHKDSMPDVIYRRAKHIITENARCQEFEVALKKDDLDKIGVLMKGSHISLRDDFEVSCPELDAMAESAWKATGCVGARMMGGGFGGACIALVKTDALPDFTAETAIAYKKKTDLGGNYLACNATDGARTLTKTR
ncbi:MAG TPA: galactokinase [Fimbriimonadaceae bacterium]|jgi:galactokinase